MSDDTMTETPASEAPVKEWEIELPDDPKIGTIAAITIRDQRLVLCTNRAVVVELARRMLEAAATP